MEERKLIGSVGVDSGQLIIMDPVYAAKHWVNKEEADIVGVKFWGEAKEEIVPLLEEQGFAVVSNYGSKLICANNEIAVRQIKRAVYKAANDIDKMIVTSVKRTSTYDKISDLTLSENQSGQLNHALGHGGLGVAFSSGLGDGIYDVYATYKDIPGWGNRITKVEIELINEDEINNFD